MAASQARHEERVMSIIDEVEALRRIPYFATMDSAKLKLLAFASHRLQLPVGGVLCREGEPGDAAYILLDGEAEVMVPARSLEEWLIWAPGSMGPSPVIVKPRSMRAVLPWAWTRNTGSWPT